MLYIPLILHTGFLLVLFIRASFHFFFPLMITLQVASLFGAPVLASEGLLKLWTEEQVVSVL